MKTMLVVFFLGCAACAFGQCCSNASVSSPFQFADHSYRASPQRLSQEQDLFTSSGGLYIEHGEMSLSDVPLPPVKVVPLGDIARALKKEHATAKKAQFIREN